MDVGRTRKTDKHLPRGVYRKHGAYWLARYEGGKKRWRRLAATYPEALQELARLEAPAGSAATVEELIRSYSAEELPGKAERTISGRVQQFREVVKVFGAMAPEDIEPAHVWRYWRERGASEQARHEISALSALLTYARRIGARIAPNPCFGLQLPGSPPRRRYVTTEEYQAVRALAPPMIRYAMDLALYAGMDQSTIRRLERRHVTDEGLLFARGKTDVLQLVEWNEALREAVRGALALRPQLRRAVICNRRGEPYTLDGFQAQWQRVMRKVSKAGLARFHFHDIRAKSASDAGSDQEAADRLGHMDPALTRRVYRRQPKRAPALKIVDKPKE
jgi:integrase